jgi:ABC-type branched-subunit amino acid transport system ATPase component
VTKLIGDPNGVGKTTLLKTILGSVEPSGGKILYEERDVTHSPTHKKFEVGIFLAPEGKGQTESWFLVTGLWKIKMWILEMIRA